MQSESVAHGLLYDGCNLTRPEAAMRAALATILSLPSLALACGGLFCSGGGAAPAPVDQSAEQIIFEVGDGRVCAHVTIDYVGDADQFAWIVPVPDTPSVGETDPDVFSRLTRGTDGFVTLPGFDPSECDWGRGGFDSEGGGCGCSGDFATASADDAADMGVSEEPPVQILGRQSTENYDTVTLAASSADDLVGWLQDNDYNVSDNMVPAMQPYLDEEMNFVAVRLRDGRTAQRIRPLTMCYRAMAPMVPIRLTAVAAQPLMGIQVFILADHFYVPHEIPALERDLSAIAFDAVGTTNYSAWVARAVDEAGGKAFVTEFRGDNPLAQAMTAWVETAPDAEPIGLQRRLPKVSRYFTRLSPHQMTFDPMFVAAPNAEPVSGDIDLSDHPSPQTCNGFFDERLANACAFEYCGRDATCVLGEQADAGCICGPGTTAQQIVDGTGVDRVTCVPRENPLAVLDEVVDNNICEQLPCGAGLCSLRGGFRTCTCEEGARAVASRRGVMCERFDEGDIGRFGPGAGRESQPTEEMLETFQLRRAGPWMACLLLFGLVWGRRRARRD